MLDLLLTPRILARGKYLGLTIGIPEFPNNVSCHPGGDNGILDEEYRSNILTPMLN